MLTKQEAIDKLNDKDWRLSHLYKIKTKKKTLELFKPNRVQREYLKTKTSRDIILKARQLGFTTLKVIEYLDDTLFNSNTTTAIIAHEQAKAQSIFQIAKLAYQHLDPGLRPRASFDNRNELYFPDTNSRIYVTTDTRSDTVNNLHLSEFAFMRKDEDVLVAALNSVPEDGNISIESTANGMSGQMYEIWEDEDSEFKKHFYNWIWDDEYRVEPEYNRDKLLEEYRDLVTQYELINNAPTRFNMDDEQLMFYIRQIRRNRRKVMQEFPLTDIEAFIASGRNVFHINDIQKHTPEKPKMRMYSDLLVWEVPLRNAQYTMGIDTGEGVGGDNAVMCVLNAHTGEQVAEFVSNETPPDELGKYALVVGRYYNNAFIVPEINGSGRSLLDKIKYSYYNIYRREIFERRTKKYTEALGWRTTMITKKILVDDLEEAIRNEDILIKSKNLLSELKTFVKSDNKGLYGYGAEGNKKDDRILGIGLALQGIKHMPKFKPPKSLAQEKLEAYIRQKEVAEQFPFRKAQPIISSHHRPRQVIRGINGR